MNTFMAGLTLYISSLPDTSRVFQFLNRRSCCFYFYAVIDASGLNLAFLHKNQLVIFQGAILFHNRFLYQVVEHRN